MSRLKENNSCFTFILNTRYLKTITTKHQKVAYHSCLRLDNSALKVAYINFAGPTSKLWLLINWLLMYKKCVLSRYFGISNNWKEA